MRLFTLIANRLIAISERRSPDFLIGGSEKPYLRRWFLIPRNRFCNIYLHNIRRSDDDRALHDHPWINLSILLRGCYIEVTPRGDKLRWAGDIVFRGPRVRAWGFHCPQGFVPWQDFTAPGAEGEIGKGCDQ